MAQGPILIFDKSVLQSLNPDEAMWLDNFFLSNITPLFYIETLADLEKEIFRGRTPEEVVGNLAYKTPDLQSHASVHHSTLLEGELAGFGGVAMDGRILQAGGRPVSLDGKKGILFSRSPEAEAFDRWDRKEFLDIERQIAKVWRRALTNIDHRESYKLFQRKFKDGKPKTLTEVKLMVDAEIDNPNRAKALEFGMAILGISPEAQNLVKGRWQVAGMPTLRSFLPYFTHMFSVDLFFYLAMAADLVGTDRPPNKVDNKVDFAYLYYLPFCMVFASSDKLHEGVVPLFLREDQSFVKGQDLKKDLGKLDAHYWALPDEVKIRSPYYFAADPPYDDSFLITRLWDKHLPGWRESRDRHHPLSKEAGEALVAKLNRIDDEAVPLDPSEEPTQEEVEYVQLSRSIRAQKGKWLRVPPEALKDAKD